MGVKRISGAHKLAHHERRGLVDWYDLLVRDHGFLRFFWHNLHEIRPGVWRSNQPSPSAVRRVAERGVKTIVNLRGSRDDGGWRLEKEACDRYGIMLVDITVRSRDVPSVEDIRNIDLLFKSIERPFLMHCKSGADRAGLMSALYLLLVEGAGVDEALKMLSLKYLHMRQAKTGLLDAFIEAYRSAEARGIGFMAWVETEFDPESIKADFLSHHWADRLVDGILRRE